MDFSPFKSELFPSLYSSFAHTTKFAQCWKIHPNQFIAKHITNKTNMYKYFSSKNAVISSRNKPSKGFTLIELMLVISILALMAAFSFSAFNNAQKNARDGKRISELEQIARALELNKDPVSGYIFVTATQFANSVYPGGQATPPRQRPDRVPILFEQFSKPA